jgi:hypothetical protein
MELAGKYAKNNRPSFEPDVMPDKQLMQRYATQSTNPELKHAALNFQYPFKMSELKNSPYSDEIKFTIMQATTGTLG